MTTMLRKRYDECSVPPLRSIAISGTAGNFSEMLIFVEACDWLRGVDLNHRPLGYEPNELPDCSTPQEHHSNRVPAGQTRFIGGLGRHGFLSARRPFEKTFCRAEGRDGRALPGNRIDSSRNRASSA